MSGAAAPVQQGENNMADLERLDIIVPEDDVDLVSGILALRAAHGWEEQNLPDGHTCFRVHGHTPDLCRGIEEEIRALLENARLEFSSIKDQDWSAAWREFFTAVPIEDTFLVLAPWMPEAENAAAPCDEFCAYPLPVVINPKTAFGTGHHQSTALCLKVLARWFKAGKIKPGQTFFDLGTGSGILAIAAARLGLTGLACDIDPVAVDNALENRALNGLDGKFEAETGSLDLVRGQTFDCVMANILAEPLKEMAPSLALRVAKGGCLVLSGILENQAAAVEDAFMAEGLPKADWVVEAGWAALVWG